MTLNSHSVVLYVIEIKIGMTKHVNLNAKIIVRAKSICSYIYICENRKYLKSTLVTDHDEIIIVMDIVSTKKIIARNITSTASLLR